MTKSAKKATPATPHSEAASEVDQRALKILTQYERNWRRQWCSTETNPGPLTKDVRYAKRAGYMFSARALTHDDLVAWLRKSFGLVKWNEVTDAFLASLSKRRLEWRSALGSFAVARAFPNHRFCKARPGEDEYRDHCTVCEFMGEPRSRTLDRMFESDELQSMHHWGRIVEPNTGGLSGSSISNCLRKWQSPSLRRRTSAS